MVPLNVLFRGPVHFSHLASCAWDTLLTSRDSAMEALPPEAIPAPSVPPCTQLSSPLWGITVYLADAHTTVSS